MLQIDVPDTELLELDQDRDVFPLEGMPCFIPGCDTSIAIFRTFKYFMDHWKTWHVSTIQIYVCAVCKWGFKTRPHTISCIKRHPHDGDFLSFLSCVRNENFIDPKGKSPPRKGSPEEIQRMERICEREEAAKRRRDAVCNCTPHHYEEMVSRDTPIDFVTQNSKEVAVIDMGGRNKFYSPPPSDMDRYIKSLKWKISICISIESVLIYKVYDVLFWYG